jgi:hypothetical protein
VAHLEEVRTRVRKDFHADVTLEVSFVEEIPLTAMGKYRYTVCELAERQGA